MNRTTYLLNLRAMAIAGPSLADRETAGWAHDYIGTLERKLGRKPGKSKARKTNPKAKGNAR